MGLVKVGEVSNLASTAGSCRRKATMLAWPQLLARINGVKLLVVTAVGLAPAATSARTTPRWFHCMA